MRFDEHFLREVLYEKNRYYCADSHNIYFII